MDAVQVRRCFTRLAIVLLCATLRAQTPSADQSWKENSNQQSPNGNLNPTRTRESHSESNGKTTDKQAIERLGLDGRYVPFVDIEKESIKIDATTTRTVEKTYVRGPDGQRTLQQINQEETRNLPGGEQKTVRSTSNPDANGAMQVVRRQVSDSKQISSNVRETRTTVLSPDLNGGLSPVAQVQERETKTGEHSSQFKKSTLLPDGNGGWQVGEVREGTVQSESGKGQTRDEKVSRPDGNGNLSVVERTVTKEGEIPGEKRGTVEKYATDIPGTSADGSLRLAERTTTVQRTGAGGSRTVQQTERANPANPSDGLNVTGKIIDIVGAGGNGSIQEKTTTLSVDSKGSLSPVWVDTSKKNIQPPVQVDTKPPK